MFGGRAVNPAPLPTKLAAFTLPFTSRRAVGVVVPIPTDPAYSIRIRSALEVRKISGCLSVVPRNPDFDAVPELPVSCQATGLSVPVASLSAGMLPAAICAAPMLPSGTELAFMA